MLVIVNIFLRYKIFLAAILIFTFFYLISTSNGLNTTADSIHYIKISKQIYQNGFISIWKNEQLVYWPPLYPLILSRFELSDGMISLRIFNYLSAIFLIIIWGSISYDILKSKWEQGVFLILLALSTNLLMISTFIWSELVFTIFFSLVVFCFKKFFSTNQKQWLWLSIIPAFLMLIQRNAGIFILIPLYLISLYFYPFSRKSLTHFITSFILSALGFSIWNIKNIVLEDRMYMLGELLPYFTPVKNSSVFLTEVGNMFYPAQSVFPYSIFISFTALSIIGWITYSSPNQRFIKVLFYTSCIYMGIWLIIPGDPSNMGRFLSIVSPILLLTFVKGIFILRERSNISVFFRNTILGFIIAFALLRIINNSLLWGGKESYIDFGKIHQNIFYEESERIIGRPTDE